MERQRWEWWLAGSEAESLQRSCPPSEMVQEAPGMKPAGYWDGLDSGSRGGAESKAVSGQEEVGPLPPSAHPSSHSLASPATHSLPQTWAQGPESSMPGHLGYQGHPTPSLL